MIEGAFIGLIVYIVVAGLCAYWEEAKETIKLRNEQFAAFYEHDKRANNKVID